MSCRILRLYDATVTLNAVCDDDDDDDDDDDELIFFSCSDSE